MSLAAPRMHAPPTETAPELDEITLRRAQNSDPDACRALVERYQQPVFALLSRLVGSHRAEIVEDLAQETFLDVFRSLSRFSPLGTAKLSTWILTIASRRAIDELRRHPAPAESVPPADAGELASAERADDAAVRRAMAAAIQQAVSALSPEYRAAFLLREYHGLEYADIARALDIDLGTVKSRLSRARAALRRKLEEVHGD